MNNTQIKILNLAANLTQERGFGGFSYLDLADEIGIKAASIYYYFKSKDDLAVALVEFTHEQHRLGFQDIEAKYDLPQERLGEIIKFFQNYVVANKFCLCGMLVAELHSVSERVSQCLDAYFNDFQAWIAKQLTLMEHKTPNTQAMCFLSALEGSLLLARVRNDPKVVGEVLSMYLDS
jgi:TetR/AcrR family transcriptional repressor of nem operon